MQLYSVDEHAERKKNKRQEDFMQVDFVAGIQLHLHDSDSVSFYSLSTLHLHRSAATTQRVM